MNQGGLSKGYEYYFSSSKNSGYIRLVARNLKEPLVIGGKDTIRVDESKKPPQKKNPPVQNTQPVQPPQPPVEKEDNGYYVW